MGKFYKKNSIKIITVSLAIFLIGLYIGVVKFTNEAHLTNPLYTRPLVKKVEIKNFIGTIIVEKADIEGFRLEFSNKKAKDYANFYPLFKMGTDTIATINGRFEPVQDCQIKHDENNTLISAEIQESTKVKLNINDYPIVKISSNDDLIFDIKNSSIFGALSNIKSAKMLGLKCSHFSIDNIIADLELDINDQVTLHNNDIGGNLTLKAQDNNLFIMQKILGNADINFKGKNSFHAAKVNGSLILNDSESIIRIEQVNGQALTRN